MKHCCQENLYRSIWSVEGSFSRSERGFWRSLNVDRPLFPALGNMQQSKFLSCPIIQKCILTIKVCLQSNQRSVQIICSRTYIYVFSCWEDITKTYIYVLGCWGAKRAVAWCNYAGRFEIRSRTYIYVLGCCGKKPQHSKG